MIRTMEKLDAIGALSGLAHETRLDVYRLLVETGPAGLAAGQIGEQLGLAPATLSFHLNHLKHAGLVDCRKDGRSLIYSADFETTRALVAYLTENCCDGQPAFCGLPDGRAATAVARSNGKNRNAALRRARRR